MNAGCSDPRVFVTFCPEERQISGAWFGRVEGILNRARLAYAAPGG